MSDKKNIINKIRRKRNISWSFVWDILDLTREYCIDHEVENSSHPCGPNTMTFRASVSGKVQLKNQYRVQGGYYDHPRSFPYALCVGTGIDKAIHSDVKEICEALQEKVEDKLTVGGVTAHYLSSYGTSFCVYGVGV